MTTSLHAGLLLKAEAQLGEGPVWCARRKVLFWTDITGRVFHRFDPVSGEACGAPVADLLCAFALLSDGRFLAAFANEIAIMDASGQRLRHLHDLERETAGNRLNDGKADRWGRFWIGSMSATGKRNAGALYRLDPNGRLHCVVDGLSTSNGLGWSPDGRTFYLTDSPARVIYAFAHDPRSGRLSDQRVFAAVADDAGRPDGLTVDSEGCVWSANWDGARVTRYSPAGEIDTVVTVPAPRPTSVALGGERLDTLYITTARIGLEADDLVRAPFSGSLFSVKVGVPGLPEPELHV